MSVTYRTSIEADIAILAPNMREQDRHEVFCSHGVTPLEALNISFSNSSECNTIIDHNEKIVGMFGVVLSGSDNAGTPWLLATGSFSEKKNRRSVIVKSKEYLKEIQGRFDKLSNRVHADNTTSIRWLRSLGFSFDQEAIWGFHPAKFIRFYWNK